MTALFQFNHFSDLLIGRIGISVNRIFYHFLTITIQSCIFSAPAFQNMLGRMPMPLLCSA